MWGNKLFPTTLDYPFGYKGLRVLFYILILIIPFLVTGVPLKFIDSSWSGTITEIKIKENLGTSSHPQYVHVHKKEDLILVIKRDDGKELEHTVLSLVERHRPGGDGTPIGKIFYHDTKYAVGDRVHKYYGFKHLYFVSQNHLNTKNCIVCGSQNGITENSCWYCRSDVIE